MYASTGSSATYTPKHSSDTPFGNDRETNLDLLAAKIPEALPFIPSEGPSHWRNLYELEPRIVAAGPGETAGRAMRFSLPDGTPVVAKRITVDTADLVDLRKTIQRMREWEAEGRHPEILGVGFDIIAPATPTSPRNMIAYLVMEDFHAPRNRHGAMVAGGRGLQTAALRPLLSRESREWVRDEIIRQLDKHDDPNMGNILFRVTRVPRGTRTTNIHQRMEGDLLIEVVSIDTEGGEINLGPRDPRYVPAASLNGGRLIEINRESQINRLNQDMQLAP